MARNIGRHAAIDHLHRKAVQPRKHIHRRAACQHIQHHLLRHCLRKSRNTFCRNAMVTCKHHHLRRLQVDVFRLLLDQSQL